MWIFTCSTQQTLFSGVFLPVRWWNNTKHPAMLSYKCFTTIFQSCLVYEAPPLCSSALRLYSNSPAHFVRQLSTLRSGCMCRCRRGKCDICIESSLSRVHYERFLYHWTQQEQTCLQVQRSSCNYRRRSHNWQRHASAFQSLGCREYLVPFI